MWGGSVQGYDDATDTWLIGKSGKKEMVMRKLLAKLAIATAIGVLAPLQLASAQQSQPAFDAKKFFEDLTKSGAASPANFDPKKFFEDLETRRAATKEPPFDAKRFFEELAKQGVKMPANFDAKKFFEDLAATGAKIPPMVDVKKG